MTAVHQDSCCCGLVLKVRPGRLIHQPWDSAIQLDLAAFQLCGPRGGPHNAYEHPFAHLKLLFLFCGAEQSSATQRSSQPSPHLPLEVVCGLRETYFWCTLPGGMTEVRVTSACQRTLPSAPCSAGSARNWTANLQVHYGESLAGGVQRSRQGSPRALGVHPIIIDMGTLRLSSAVPSPR